MDSLQNDTGHATRRERGWLDEMQARGFHVNQDRDADRVAEIRHHSESAYRRGFQHAIVAMGRALKMGDDQIFKSANLLAADMRFDGAQHPYYVVEFQTGLAKILASAKPELEVV